MKNTIYFGDNLKILKKLPSESVDLIYIDPPFNTGKLQKHTRLKTTRSKNGSVTGFQGQRYKIEELGTRSYQDSFEENEIISSLEIDNSYKILAPNASLYFLENFLRPRLEEAYRLLKPDGSLYFHIDYREVHYCKILLDKIFGRENFINEIIWAYDYGGRPKTKWPAKHDNILFYAKDVKNYVFNADDIDKESYMAPGLVGAEKAEKGKLPTDTWWPSYTGTDKPKSSSDTWWFFFAKGQQNDTWWQTIVPTGSKERQGYPTQKPRKLIDRIIKASSNTGDVVLDFFAGSGTVGESCAELDRKFILIDKNKSALEVIAKRLKGYSNIKWINFDPNPFQKGIKAKPKLEDDINNDKTIKLSDEFVVFATTANYLREDLEEASDMWNKSPFEWVLKLPPRKKGKLGGKLVSSWLTSKGLEVGTIKDSSETIVINGYKIAIKFSTLWTNGFYTFQQIRSSGYDYVICLGLSPFNVHCWVFDKKYAIEHSKKQHKGGAKSEYWMPINPNAIPEWAVEHGGALTKAYDILRKKTKK